MADTSGCCGGPKNRHLPGCDGEPASGRKARAVKKRKEKQEEFDAAKARQKENAKLRNVGVPRSTEWMNAEIPQGYRSVKTGDGRYIIVKK